LSTLPADDISSREANAVAPTNKDASSGGRNNPLWLLVFASAVFFAFAAALLASG
jgi:hypothetical protein